MKKQITASITISDLKDGELIGFQSEDLIKKTDYYDKNDVINYKAISVRDYILKK